MAFGSFNPQRQQSMMSDINVTPMVDVMLVLLVIFIIAAPMMTSAVKLELPSAKAELSQAQPDSVTISIDASGAVFWGNEKVDPAAFERKLRVAAASPVQPDIALRADKSTRYEAVAQVMAAAQQHGLTKLGFVTDPKEKPDGKR